ncbi:MAG: hypothetical protein ACE5GE_07970 [Phycisphaerae bacterium]
MGRRVLHQFCIPYDPDEGDIDLARLRLAVAELMERGAQALQADGYEQDDAVLDRLAKMRYAGQTRTLLIDLESLTDRGRLLRPFHEQADRAFGRAQAGRRVEIVGLVLEVVVDPDGPIASIGQG